MSVMENGFSSMHIDHPVIQAGMIGLTGVSFTNMLTIYALIIPAVYYTFLTWDTPVMHLIRDWVSVHIFRSKPPQK